MLRRHATIYRQLNILVDIIIVGGSFMLAILLWKFVKTGGGDLSRLSHYYYGLFFVVICIWPLVLKLNGLYPTNRPRSLRRIFVIVLKSALQGALALFALLFLLKMSGVSRLIIGSFVVMSTGLIVLKESMVLLCSRLFSKHGINVRHVMIVGVDESVERMIAVIDEQPLSGLMVVGVLLSSKEAGVGMVGGKKVLGTIDQIEHFLHTIPVDNVIITADKYDDSLIPGVISLCKEEGVEVWLTTPVFLKSGIGRFEADELLDIPILVFGSGPQFSIPILIKKLLDRMVGLIGSIVTFPVVIIAGLLIKATSRGPVIFEQKRCGLRGKVFTMYKLRTMYENGDDIKTNLKDQNIMRGPIFKMHHDPRVTVVGKYLRISSIDEIPQFWNMLKGEMSLVGPRPSIPNEVSEYQNWHRRRFSMKPGITGLLQVSGRSNIIDFNKWIEYDLKYIDNWSLWLDLKIILRTIFVVISTKGAK